MENKEIKELMLHMKRTGTSRLAIKHEGFELELEREERTRFVEPSMDLFEDNSMRQEIAYQRANMVLSKGGEMPGAIHHHSLPPRAPEAEVAGTHIVSPMVGTFYSAPSPEDSAFVKVGDKVEKDTVVGIIEAMKVMNEIKAGAAGTVAEILVTSGHPVEFGTKLFRIT